MRLPEEEEEKEEGKKCLQREDEDEEEDEGGGRHPTPPDGGWGWCVVAAAFFSIMMVDGVCFSLTAIYQPIMETFQASNYQVALMGSMMAGCYLLVGPFVSVLCGRYGCRKVTIAGSIVATCGISFSTQVSSIEMMILLYGIVTGVGFGMIYLPSIVSVGYWFSNKRAFTTGIALCGSGVGQFVIPPLSRHLVEQYKWTGANVIIAGLVLNCAVCGMIYFPLDKRPKSQRRKERNPTRVEIERGAIMKALIEEKKRQRTISNGSLDNCIITRDNRLIKLDPKIFELKRDNSFIARFKRQLGFSSQSLNGSNKSLQGIPSIVIDAVQKEVNNSKLAVGAGGGSGAGSPIYRPHATRVQQLSQSHLYKRSSLPLNGAVANGGVTNGLAANGTAIHYSVNQVGSPAACSGNGVPNGALTNGSCPNGFPKTRSCDDLHPHGNDPWVKQMPDGEVLDVKGLSLQQVALTTDGNPTAAEGSQVAQFIVGDSPTPTLTRSVSDLPSTPILPATMLDGSVISIQVIPNGTVNMGGSQQSFRQRSSNSMMSQASSDASYATSASVMSIHVQESMVEEEVHRHRRRQKQQESLYWNWRSILLDMFAFRVLMNPVFALLVLSTFITMLGFLVPYIYMPDLVVPKDEFNVAIDPSPGMFLISIMGVANTVGRVLTGWFADRPWCNTLYLNNGALVLGGVAVALSPVLATPTALSILAAIFGLSMAVFNSLRSILLVDLLGLETLTKSFGLLILFQGIAAFFSAPVAGLIMDIMGEPTYSLYLAGAFIVISGLVMFLICCLPSRMQQTKGGKCGGGKGGRDEYLPSCNPPITKTFKLQSGV